MAIYLILLRMKTQPGQHNFTKMLLELLLCTLIALEECAMEHLQPIMIIWTAIHNRTSFLPTLYDALKAPKTYSLLVYKMWTWDQEAIHLRMFCRTADR